MAEILFKAHVKKIADSDGDVQVVLKVQQADEVWAELGKVRNLNVWVTLQTEQATLEDLERIAAEELKRGRQTTLFDPSPVGPQSVTVDRTGFQVPREIEVGGEKLLVQPGPPPEEGAEPYVGPTEFVCNGCGEIHPEIIGACSCGGREYTERPATPVEPLVPVPCDRCGGSGSDPDLDSSCEDQTCQACLGTGEVFKGCGYIPSPDVAEQLVEAADTCPDCKGARLIDWEPCKTCDATGKLPPRAEDRTDVLKEVPVDAE
jgi:hypothetical protein